MINKSIFGLQGINSQLPMFGNYKKTQSPLGNITNDSPSLKRRRIESFKVKTHHSQPITFLRTFKAAAIKNVDIYGCEKKNDNLSLIVLQRQHWNSLVRKSFEINRH